MDNLQLVKALCQEYDLLDRSHKPRSWEDKCIQQEYTLNFPMSTPRRVTILTLASWKQHLDTVYGDYCVICGEYPIVYHHVFPTELFPELATHPDNGIILCYGCHSKVHSVLKRNGFVTRLDYEQILSNIDYQIADGYTVEELAKLSGYSVKTIYNLTAYKVVPPPSRGSDPTKYKSRGLYPKQALSKLQRFAELRSQGKKKDEILCLMRKELLAEEAIICQ